MLNRLVPSGCIVQLTQFNFDHEKTHKWDPINAVLCYWLIQTGRIEIGNYRRVSRSSFLNMCGIPSMPDDITWLRIRNWENWFCYKFVIFFVFLCFLFKDIIWKGTKIRTYDIMWYKLTSAKELFLNPASRHQRKCGNMDETKMHEFGFISGAN